MKLEEADEILSDSDRRVSFGITGGTEYMSVYDKETVILDGEFTVDELKKLISFMESIED